MPNNTFSILINETNKEEWNFEKSISFEFNYFYLILINKYKNIEIVKITGGTNVRKTINLEKSYKNPGRVRDYTKGILQKILGSNLFL